MSPDEAKLQNFTAEDFRRRALHNVNLHNGEEYGDHILNPAMKSQIFHDGLRNAAVLVPVVDRDEGASVILTRRTEKLRSHSGQVAFPGGRVDPTDPSLEFTALRETEEEIGLTPDYIEIVGRMPHYVAGSGFRIAPILSVVRPGFDLKINEDEVDSAFEVPLAFLMNPHNHTRDSRMWNEQERFFYTMPFGERYIWGITAGIIRSIYERLYA